MGAASSATLDRKAAHALPVAASLACAIASTDDNGFFTPSNVIEPLSNILGRPIEIANFQRHLAEFITENRGKILIRRGAERQYRFRFRDPMMQPYLIIRGLRKEMIPDTLAV
ncbi:MAG: hypothetical protein ACLPKT_00160 [Methylocella sp.]